MQLLMSAAAPVEDNGCAGNSPSYKWREVHQLLAVTEDLSVHAASAGAKPLVPGGNCDCRHALLWRENP
jgi:hypothetical protein